MRMRDDIVECYDLVADLNSELKGVKTWEAFEKVEEKVYNAPEEFELGFYSKRGRSAEATLFQKEPYNCMSYLYRDGKNSGSCSIDKVGKTLEIRSDRIIYRMDKEGNLSRFDTMTKHKDSYIWYNQKNEDVYRDSNGKQVVNKLIHYTCSCCGEVVEFKDKVYNTSLDFCPQCDAINDLTLRELIEDVAFMDAHPRYYKCIKCGRLFIARKMGVGSKDCQCIHCRTVDYHERIPQEECVDIEEKYPFLKRQRINIGQKSFKHLCSVKIEGVGSRVRIEYTCPCCNEEGSDVGYLGTGKFIKWCSRCGKVLDLEFMRFEDGVAQMKATPALRKCCDCNKYFFSREAFTTETEEHCPYCGFYDTHRIESEKEKEGILKEINEKGGLWYENVQKGRISQNGN